MGRRLRLQLGAANREAVPKGELHREPIPALSAEIFVMPLAQDDRYLVYAPLRRAALVGNGALVNLLADLRDGPRRDAPVPDLATVELLRRLEIVDAGPEPLPVTTWRGSPAPTTVTLFLTTACNLRCTYCYASAGDTPVRTMSLAVARRGIDFVANNAVRSGQQSFEVAYHGGGEPTVNWTVLTTSYEYARERATALGLRVQASAATNGVLSDRQLGWIVEHLDGASLSCDGLPAVHDRHRLTVAGQGSSDRVVRTLRTFDRHRFRYGLRLTVTPEHLGRLEESVAYLCREFRPETIQVEPVYRMGRWSHGSSAETEAFVDAFRRARLGARRWGHDLHFSGVRLDDLSNHFCGVTQDSFCLTPDGNVSACYEAFSEEGQYASRFLYGSSDEDGTFRFRLPVLRALRRESVDRRSYCQGCFAKWSCGGDCYHKALVESDGAPFHGTARCQVIRALTQDEILERIAASGGLFWHEPPPREPR